MNMHNPPHPGPLLKRTYMDPYGLSVRYMANKLEVAPSTFAFIVKGEAKITPKMALRLGSLLNCTPQSLLNLQDSYDLWIESQKENQPILEPINFAALEMVQ